MIKGASKYIPGVHDACNVYDEVMYGQCLRCGWEGYNYPVYDGGVFGGLEVCPKCNWTPAGRLHTGADWIYLELEDEEEAERKVEDA
ncbi:MAG: hypothetical protein WC891_08685 [Actinomycetota bacterium]|jgi:hypothetical protein